MYDDFEFGSSRTVQRMVLIAAACIAAVLVLGAVAFMLERGSGSAEASSGGGAARPTQSQRCLAALHNEYASLAPATIGPKTFRILAPRICAAGIAKGVVRGDGTMSKSDGYDVTRQVISTLGTAGVQTLMWNELAVKPYHLARPGRVTRWDRCVAMMYSAYDELTPSQRAGAGLPPRAKFLEAARYACTLGVQRHLVPASGAPTRADTARMLRAGVLHVSA